MLSNIDEANNLARMERPLNWLLHVKDVEVLSADWTVLRNWPGESWLNIGKSTSMISHTPSNVPSIFTCLNKITPGKGLLIIPWMKHHEWSPAPTPCSTGVTDEEEDAILHEYPWIERPINIDYRTNIPVGSNVFINFNCTFLDTCIVSIGSRTLVPRLVPMCDSSVALTL